jgi:hypothetical protein
MAILSSKGFEVVEVTKPRLVLAEDQTVFRVRDHGPRRYARSRPRPRKGMTMISLVQYPIFASILD